jgi:hypothetical protein
MGMMYHDYKFKSEEFQNSWRCLTTHTFENMELYFRKQFSMTRLLSHFKKSFGIAPITLKNSTNDDMYKNRFLAIYLLTKYSKEDFTTIAKEFHISEDTVKLIFANDTYKQVFQDDVKLFFKQFEEDYLIERKSSLAFNENMQDLIKNLE